MLFIYSFVTVVISKTQLKEAAVEVGRSSAIARLRIVLRSNHVLQRSLTIR